MGDDIAMPSIGAMSRAQPAAATAVPMSLNAALQGDAAPVKGQPAADDEEADLFALPISPRSPDMKKSPFSIF